MKPAIFFDSMEEYENFMMIYRMGQGLMGQPNLVGGSTETEGIETEIGNPMEVKPAHVPEDPQKKTGWRKVKAWDGQKDPYETRPGKYRQGWNADGTIGSMEFLPDGESE